MKLGAEVHLRDPSVGAKKRACGSPFWSEPGEDKRYEAFLSDCSSAPKQAVAEGLAATHILHRLFPSLHLAT
ncbi:hypothetical protein CLOP_g13713 [Closterium sp. NIES-67]|nr:hypothetical protein CLOP_g13713 [Closterium sp. NIES-67]